MSAFAFAGSAFWLFAEAPVVTRMPESGIQPQVVMTPNGATHMVYFKGKPEGGDLFYVQRAAGGTRFSSPAKVNSKAGSAVAIGTIRGAQIALGRNGRIHVVWNGASAYKTDLGIPLFYTRLKTEGAGFEPERNVMKWTKGLDGGASVAADGNGNVFVIWHGATQSGSGDEERELFLARSKDDGEHFDSEWRINPENSGACACCGLKAFANSLGEVFVLYRAARNGLERDETLLVSNNGGRTFSPIYEDPWKSGTCPMSSAWLNSAGKTLLAGWETKGRVRFCIFGAGENTVIGASTASVNQKYPVSARNAQGQIILVWCDGVKWGSGGTVCWQILDRDGKQMNDHGTIPGLPPWSFAAVLPRPDGRFEIIY